MYIHAIIGTCSRETGHHRSEGKTIAKESAAHMKWVKENTTRIVMNLNHNTDADILQKLAQVDSKQGYIKELIRKDLQSSHTAKP